MHEVQPTIDQGEGLSEGEAVGDPELRQPVRRYEPDDDESESSTRGRTLHLTGFLTVAIPGISTSTMSPLFNGPTPDGVPVAMTSPGSSVITAVIYSISAGMGKAI
jgi:hypothetical protein